MRRVIVAAIAVIAVSGCDALFGPRNYDDCILKNMRGVTSDVAAANIQRSCRAKFPTVSEAEILSRDLEPSQVANLAGRAGLSYGNHYSGSIYNSNNDITVTQVRIRITTKSDGQDVSRTYAADVDIPPLSTKDFGVDIVVGDKGAGYSWDIEGARGY